MSPRTRKWITFLTLILAAGAGSIVWHAPAHATSPPRQADHAQVPPPSTTLDAGPAPQRAPLDIAGSGVSTEECYQDDKSQTLCFAIYNGSPDFEWLTDVRLTFPTAAGAWTVSCNPAYQDPVDSQGNPVNMACSTPVQNEVLYSDNDADGYGEISSGSSWQTCVDVTVPAGYTGDRFVAWELRGDLNNVISGTTVMEKCTPLTLKPRQTILEGCNGAPQRFDFELTNYAAGDTDVDLFYDFSPNVAYFSGMNSTYLQEGSTVSFTVELEPALCLEPGQQITARLTVESPLGHADSAVINQTISADAGWHRRADSPVATMDNAVIWANDGDGGLWSVGGYGSHGAAQRYDPPSGTWITYTNPLSPIIEYPMDGCYGRNDVGDEIIVLFPDTQVTGTLQIFNVTHTHWYTEPVPSPGYPAEGRWGQAIVSMLQHTGENACYLSGGSTEPGGGRTRDLWRYNPGDNTAQYVGAFPAGMWFGFHASWYVPWIGTGGGICVAGGVDHNHQITNSTQCYDLDAATFNGLNADLGTLPEPWWGMADGWSDVDGTYRLWIANGVAQNGTLLPASAYFEEGMTDFAYGPPLPDSLYRLEGDAWEGEFYTLNGSQSGFWSSTKSLHLAPCPICHACYMPLILRQF